MQRRQEKKLMQYYGIGALVILVAVGLWLWLGQKTVRFERLSEWVRPGVSSTLALSENCEWRSKLNGACVNDPTRVAEPVVAVMVENHVAARPQSGLVDAAIVYEAPVEGNYTRFLALYSLGSEVKKVGPVRSARPYFLDWLPEWGKPLYMHVGGSPAALEKIAAHTIFNFNEMTRGWYFWRSTDRLAPHNTYTSSALWQKAWKDYKGTSEAASSSWHFLMGSSTCEFNCAGKITVSFLPPAYEAVWQFVTSTRQYERWQMNAPHMDQDGRTITADTIVVQFIKTKVLDAIGRLQLNTVGEGEVLVFRDGTKQHGTWRKPSLNAPTIWLGSDGAPLTLKPGKIWIELVPRTSGDVTF